jgi:hypothetical protein
MASAPSRVVNMSPAGQLADMASNIDWCVAWVCIKEVWACGLVCRCQGRRQQLGEPCSCISMDALHLACAPQETAAG